jgi:hypothetical protein
MRDFASLFANVPAAATSEAEAVCAERAPRNGFTLSATGVCGFFS